MSFEACLLKTIYPALHAALGTLGRVLFAQQTTSAFITMSIMPVTPITQR